MAPVPSMVKTFETQARVHLSKLSDADPQNDEKAISDFYQLFERTWQQVAARDDAALLRCQLRHAYYRTIEADDQSISHVTWMPVFREITHHPPFAEACRDPKIRKQVYGEESQAKVGEPAPPLEGWTSDGRKIALEQLRGKVVILDFFTTWCKPCIQEMPQLERLTTEHNEIGKDRVVLLYLTAETDREFDASGYKNPTDFEKKHRLEGNVIRYGSSFNEYYETRKYPTTYVVGKDGKILFVQHGSFADSGKWDHFRSRIVQAVK